MNNLLRLLLFVLVAVLVIVIVWFAIGMLPVAHNIRLLLILIVCVVILIYGITTFKGGGGPL